MNKVSDDTFTVHSTAAEAATGANAVNFTDATITAKTGFTTDISNDKITLASHGLTTGNTVYVKEGTIPGGLTAGNSYFISVSGDDIHFHTTSADATAGANKVDLTSAGSSDFELYADSGTLTSITVAGGASISQYNFGADGKVKMLLTDGNNTIEAKFCCRLLKTSRPSPRSVPTALTTSPPPEPMVLPLTVLAVQKS